MTSIGIGDGSHDPKVWRELREEAITQGIEKKKAVRVIRPQNMIEMQIAVKWRNLYT